MPASVENNFGHGGCIITDSLSATLRACANVVLVGCFEEKVFGRKYWHHFSARPVCCTHSPAQVCRCAIFLSASQFRVQNICSWFPGTCPWEKIQESTLCRSGSVAARDVGVSNPTLARDQRCRIICRHHTHLTPLGWCSTVVVFLVRPMCAAICAIHVAGFDVMFVCRRSVFKKRLQQMPPKCVSDHRKRRFMAN